MNFTLQESDFSLLGKLSQAHKEILLTEGTYLEKAAALNIPIGTVRSRLSRARRNLIALRGQE